MRPQAFTQVMHEQRGKVCGGSGCVPEHVQVEALSVPGELSALLERIVLRK